MQIRLVSLVFQATMNRILINSAQTSFHPDRTLQMSIQSKYLWSERDTLEFGICSRFSDASVIAYFKTSSNDIQKTPSEPPCGIKISRNSSVHSFESSDQSPMNE